MPTRTAADRRNDLLFGWYSANKRELPWRLSTDPYRVMVSEAMLQQTQVQRVIPRFEQFVDRWPTEDALAEASNAEVLEAWSGLGYNSRSIRLRDAARITSEQGWPRSVPGLKELPGIGPYTAAAIASICFGATVPAVDTNLRRVLSRWFGEPLTGSDLRDFAGEVVGDPAGTWNQALMDLGSTLCTTTSPGCSGCPVTEYCADPTVYEPPPRQSRFEGSHRQLRGALVRAHIDGVSLREAGQGLGRSSSQIETAIRELTDEGLLD